MTACTHTLADHPTGLHCLLEDGHQFGHRYESSSVSDMHDVSEQRAEEARG